MFFLLHACCGAFGGLRICLRISLVGLGVLFSKLFSYSVLPTDEQAELQVPEDQSEGLVMSHDLSQGRLSDEEKSENDDMVSNMLCLV
jgi:hypothetical protein